MLKDTKKKLTGDEGEGHYAISCSGCDMSIELEQK